MATIRRKNMRPPVVHRETLEMLKKKQADRQQAGASVEVIKAPPKPEEPIPVLHDENESPSVKKDLLVGTVFIDDSAEQHKWFDLQSRYLKATTSDFDHVTFIQDGEQTGLFEGTKIISDPGKTKAKQSKAHVMGLTHLLEYFRKHQDKYNDFLFIDSDAFPIRKDWITHLRRKMVNPYEIAVVIRPENLEQRLHSSIIFAKKKSLPNLGFSVGKNPLNDLTGHGENDVSCKVYQTARRKMAFPLLKSNKVNLNPMLCSVYYDLFYHNGVGSGRKFSMRARPYWDHMVDMNPDIKHWFNQLMKDPNKFIGELAGWNPAEYPEV